MSTTVHSAAPADKSTIANLVQLYLYDMTGELPFPVGPDGRFAYDRLEAFWQHPYLIRHNDELAGFALLVDSCPITGRTPCFFMAEFFVLKAYRRRGVGRAAFEALFARYPGPWQIGVIERNRQAMAFWSRVLEDRAAGRQRLEHEGESWLLYAFDVRSKT